MAPVKSKKSAKQSKKIVIDATAANAEGSNIVDVDAFAKYLKEHIKVEGRTGQLEDKVTVSTSGDKITVVSSAKFSGKYAKYLTKRFLKKNELRDWLRVVATSRGVYQLRYFQLANDEEDAAEEDDEEEDEDDE